MASLKDLLAEDGFRKRERRRRVTATAAATRAVSMPLYPDPDKNLLFSNAESTSHKGRATSDVVFGRSRSYLSEKGGAGDRRWKTSMLHKEKSRYKFHGELQEAEECSEVISWCNGSPKGSQGRSRGLLRSSTEDFEIHRGSGVCVSDEFGFEGKELYRLSHKSQLYEDGKFRRGSDKILKLKPSFDDYTQRNDSVQPSIYGAAIQAVVSILTGHIKSFFKDDSLRALLHNCNACLGIGNLNENDQSDGGVLAELEKAITAIDRVVKEGRGMKELEKASLKLSSITGLSSIDLKDGFTLGIPNSHLAACAHLYLSVICKIQKKGRIAANHLLQVFCNAPFEARTILLPALWDQFFLPHLSHLKAWYEKEVESISQTSSKAKNMKLLKKMYNDVLNLGTHKFAVYYKEWLVDETKAPLLPSIHVPFASYSRITQGSHAIDRDEVSSSNSAFSYEPMVSQKFYQSVFSQLKKVDAANQLKIREHDELKEGEKEIKVDHSDIHVRNCKSLLEEYGGIKMTSSCSGKKEHICEQGQESQRTGFEKLDTSSNGVELTTTEFCKTHKLDEPQAKTNEHTLNKLAQEIFESHAVDRHFHNDYVPLKQFANFPACNNFLDNNVPRSETWSTESELKKTGLLSRNSDLNSLVLRNSAVPFDCYEDIDRGSALSNIPADFLCPLTGQLFKDPVTIETGQTFERIAIKEWLSQGKTCPMTGQQLQCLSVPDTNFVLKQLVDVWVSENCRNILVLTAQMAENEMKSDNKSKDDLALDIMDILLTGYSKEEQMENARNLMALGGLHFLIRRFEKGSLDEKARVVGYLLCCINAKGCCRKYLADNLKRSCVLELLQSNQVSARTNAVLLLVELICLNRRKAITSFLSGLLTETIANTMHSLLVYLHSSPPKEKAMVAVLLLHFDLMLGACKKSIYKEEAVNGIILALNCCLSDKKAIPNSQRALLMLGGHFSTSGEILIDSWLLQQEGFLDGSSNTTNYRDDDEVDENLLEDEPKQKEKWLKDISLVLLGNGKRSFVETLSKCLVSGNQDLVRTCLVTLAWMSHALVLLSAAHHIPLAVLSAVIPQLKEQIEKKEQVEHRFLASICLLNFSKIPGKQKA